MTARVFEGEVADLAVALCDEARRPVESIVLIDAVAVACGVRGSGRAERLIKWCVTAASVASRCVAGGSCGRG